MKAKIDLMSDIKIPNEQWQKIEQFLRSQGGVYLKADTRHFLEAMLWMSRSGAQWRLLPAEYGAWNSVYKRFARWDERGIWEAMLTYFAQDAAMESVMLDSTIIRAHPSAAGALKKTVDRSSKRWDAAEAGLAPKSTSP
jgi:putative transposase